MWVELAGGGGGGGESERFSLVQPSVLCERFICEYVTCCDVIIHDTTCLQWCVFVSSLL